jgi:MATE family multidrug resistance protein
MLKAFVRKYKSYYVENLFLAIPIVGSQIGHMAVHFADGVIVGHFAGKTQLAAVSLVNSLFNIIMVIGLGITFGLTPLIAKHFGSKNKEECGKLLSNSFVINLLSGLFLYCLLHFGTLAVIDRLGQRPEVLFYAKPYLFYLSISIIPLMVFQTFKQFAEGLGFTFQAMLISIVGNIFNITLGIILVRGMFGISPMGVKGVGISTLTDRTIMAVVMAVYVLRSKHFKDYLKKFRFFAIDKIRSIQLIKIGAPVAMQYFFEISAFSGAVILAGRIGVVEQGAHHIAITLAALTYMVASGVASAATIKTGNYFGKQSFTDLRRSAIASYHIVIVFMLITAVIFVCANQLLPHIFISDSSVISVAAQLLIIAGLFQLFDGTQVVGLGVLRGVGDVNVPTLITFLSYWLIAHRVYIAVFSVPASDQIPT